MGGMCAALNLGQAGRSGAVQWCSGVRRIHDRASLVAAARRFVRRRASLIRPSVSEPACVRSQTLPLSFSFPLLSRLVLFERAKLRL